jgi:hypothetical protein
MKILCCWKQNTAMILIALDLVQMLVWRSTPVGLLVLAIALGLLFSCPHFYDLDDTL